MQREVGQFVVGNLDSQPQLQQALDMQRRLERLREGITDGGGQAPRLVIQLFVRMSANKKVAEVRNESGGVESLSRTLDQTRNSIQRKSG